MAMSTAGLAHLEQLKNELKPVFCRLLESRADHHPPLWFEIAWKMVNASVEYCLAVMTTLPHRLGPFPFATTKDGQWSDEWINENLDTVTHVHAKKEDAALDERKRYWMEVQRRCESASTVVERTAFIEWYISESQA